MVNFEISFKKIFLEFMGIYGNLYIKIIAGKKEKTSASWDFSTGYGSHKSTDQSKTRLQRQLSRLMTKPTKWHVRPAKTQISLVIRPVFAVRMKKATHSAHRRLRSDWADDQADLCLRWADNHFDGFVMRRLKFTRGTVIAAHDYNP